MKKEYTFGEMMQAINKENENKRVIIEYLLNKNSKPLPQGVDYKQFYDDMQDFCESLID